MNGTTRSVLLVEDYDIDQEAVKRAFKEVKIKNPLVITGNGEEALAYLKNSKNPRPCLILLDLNMPKMNGVEFLEHVKKDDHFKRIPVVMFTTSDEETDKVETYNLGVAGYVVKPPNHDKFAQFFKTIDVYWTLSKIPQS